MPRTIKAERIAGAIQEDGGYRWVGLYDVNFQLCLVSNIAWSGPSAPAYPAFPITKGLTSRVIAKGKTINIGDVSNDPSYLTALDGTRSEIIIPVLDDDEGRVVGTIDVESERLHAFDSETQARLEECVRVLKGFWVIATKAEVTAAQTALAK